MGGRLYDARKKKKLTIEEVEEGTKVRAKYLEAIESDSWREFPSKIYVYGFVKRYADFIGLDGVKILEEFKTQFCQPSKSTFSRNLADQSRLNKFVITPKIILGTMVVVAVAVIVGYLVIAINKFSSPPVIDVIAPHDQTVYQKSLAIEGKTLATAQVEINGQSVNVDDAGNFSQKVDLTPGVNYFEIKSQNRLGKESTRLIKVLYDTVATATPTATP